MPRLKRVEGSLRSNGMCSIAIDLPTRAKLKELAGDMPVSRFVRELAFSLDKAVGGGAGSDNIPLPSIVPPNKETTLGQAVALFFGERFDEWLTSEGITKKWSQDAPHLAVKEFLRRLKAQEIQPAFNLETKGELTA